MKKLLYRLVPPLFFLLFAGVIGYAIFDDVNYKHELPTHTAGNYFNVEWLAPKDAVYYRAFIADDSLKIIFAPFACQELWHMPAVRKKGVKQSITVKYPYKGKDYDLYVRLFAFDIDDNYWNVKLLNLES